MDEIRTVLEEIIEKVVKLHTEPTKPHKPCQVFDENGRYKFIVPPPKQNFKLTH